MNINIKATNTTLTDALRDAVESKFSTLEPFIKPEHKLHVEIEVDTKHKSGEVFRVEATVQPHNYFAEATATDAYSAIDAVLPKIKEQLVKEKDKEISDRRRLGAEAKEEFLAE